MDIDTDTPRHESNENERRALFRKFVFREAAGSLGDLGTFVPIVVGMTQIVGLDAGTVLVFAGLANIVTGLAFGMPIPVQPMKAICVLAIAGTMGPAEVAVAGLAVGLIVFVLAVSGFIGTLYRLIPRAAIQGLQMAVAVQLMIAGVRLGLFGQTDAVLRPWWGPDALLVFLGGIAVTVLLRRRLGLLAACLIGLGLVGAWMKEPGLVRTLGFSLWRPRCVLADISGLAGIWRGGLPQVPLTLLNSVFAASVLAGELFPGRRNRVTPVRLSISVGLMNFVSCPFGGMPICHGSGGLAGQYEFGARSSLSMVILGSAKLLIGLLFGTAALAWMYAFPSSILAVFLMVAAVGLARASHCWEARNAFLTALAMVAVHFATGILILGFVSGWVVYAILLKMDNRSWAVARESDDDRSAED